MRSFTLLCILLVCLACFIVESEAQRGGARGGGGRGGGRGGGGRGGGRGGYGGGRGWGSRGGWGRGRGGSSSYSSSSYYRRPSYYPSYYGYGRRGGGLLGLLFGRNRGYGYNNYGYNYDQEYCRVAQFVDYVGSTPRYYCDCPPYAPSYQYNQCIPMPTYK